MKILISGSSGLIGSSLQSYLKNLGHHVVCLIRNNQEQGPDTIPWNPNQEELDSSNIEGFDVVINLSGENIAGGRWTEQQKERILNSRIKSTSTLIKTIRKLKNPPKVFLSTSAIGFYGNRGDILCTEETSAGSGFLPTVCQEWEAAAQSIKLSRTRIAILRFGVVLDPNGGALGKMLTPFRLGLGGILGSGNQYMSWISIDDLLSIILLVINDDSLVGPINVVSPQPVTNRHFTKTLGKVLHRPTFLSVPAFALRLMLGQEMADEMLLSSTRVMPHKLLNAGYNFVHSNLEEALTNLLHK